MKTILPVFLLTFLFMSSCGEKKQSAQEMLKDKVMAVHDEIMPKMGDIMKYKKELNAKIKALTEAGSEENATQIDELTKAVEGLENSHEGMMNWMHQYNSDFEDKVQEEVMAYLKGQMTKIEDVAKTTNSALKKAEELLAN